MLPFIVIREYKPADEFICKEIIRNYVMSFAQSAFITCIFREVILLYALHRMPKCNFILFFFYFSQIFIQLTVLLAALLFIFFGVPLMFCVAALPLVCVILLLSIYSTYLAKAIELTSEPMRTCWVAEAYEPYILSLGPTKQEAYDIVPEESILPNDVEVNRMRRQVVGFIGIAPHKALENCGWINRLSINSNYNFDKVAEPLINRALKYGLDMNFYSIESATTECQFDARELLLRMGFSMKQIYHKQVLGCSSFRIMKSQLGIDLMTWAVTKNK